ncbi:MAG: hypothetical protein LBL24_07650 [Bacteroidales bacterium]|jgi:hypothetical protein|nr:hypothetical protein [Bacteroidales bacterium]
MKKIVFPFLGVLMLVFSSCIDKGNNIQSFGQVAAVVGYSSSGLPVIQTYNDSFVVPELSDYLLTDLNIGDPVLAYFDINFDNQPSTEYYTISNFEYVKVGKGYPEGTPEGKSRYDDFSEEVGDVFVIDMVHNILFLGIRLIVSESQTIEYELTFDPEEEVKDNIPTLYLRVRKSGTGTESLYNLPYAFDMSYASSFLSPYRDASTNQVKVNIKCKTGVNDEGEDEYKLGSYNPYTLVIK